MDQVFSFKNKTLKDTGNGKKYLKSPGILSVLQSGNHVIWLWDWKVKSGSLPFDSFLRKRKDSLQGPNSLGSDRPPVHWAGNGTRIKFAWQNTKKLTTHLILTLRCFLFSQANFILIPFPTHRQQVPSLFPFVCWTLSFVTKMTYCQLSRGSFFVLGLTLLVACECVKSMKKYETIGTNKISFSCEHFVWIFQPWTKFIVNDRCCYLYLGLVNDKMSSLIWV